MQRIRRLLAVVAALAWLTGATAISSPAERDLACVRLDNRIAELRLKMRLGYSAKQGRTYRQKLAGLEAERRAKCHK